MKKTLTIIFTAIILIVNVTCPVNTFASDINQATCVVNSSSKENDTTYLFDYVNEQLSKGREYVFSTSDFTFSNASDFVTYVRSNDNVDFKKAKKFVDSIYNNLRENDGKIIGDYGTEDLGIYGACIVALSELGYNVCDFYGYNIQQAFENSNADISNPYYYRLAIECASDEFAHTLCNKFITDYYTMGKGMNYWGYSCDNTATFLTAIAKYSDDYSEYVEDAKNILASYTDKNGAFYSFDYNTVNANSTASALMAFSALNDTENALKYYNFLIEFQDDTGVFTYYGAPDTYATRDCVTALGYFSDLVRKNNVEHNKHYCKTNITKATTSKNGKTEKVCSICGSVASSTTIYSPKTISLSTTSYTYNGNVRKPVVTVKDSKGNTLKNGTDYTLTYASGRKNVGKYSVKVTFKGNYSGSKTLYFTIKPKSTSISKLTAKSKGFTVKWNKQATQVSGYQIQYSTSSSFSNAKTKTISGASNTSRTVSKLSYKKYYVRVRTYKTVNGTNYYSAWSGYKSVKVK